MAALAVAILLPWYPVLFGIGFPYSLATFELVVFVLFASAVVAGRIPSRDLLALLWLALGFGLHLVLHRADFGALGSRGLCVGETISPSGIDTVAAADSFRRFGAYVVLFLLVRQWSRSPRASSLLTASIAATAVLLMTLGLVAPRDSGNILWFHAVPTHDRHWLSSSIHPLLTDLWGYSRTFFASGIPVVLDELQVSGRPVGPIFNENQFASALGISFPVLLGVVAQRMRGGAVGSTAALAGFSLAVVVVTGWLTQSMGGVLAMLAGLAAFFVGAKDPIARRSLAALTGLVVVMICIGVPALRTLGEVPWVGGRATVWLQTARVIVEHPLLGIGAGNFPDLRLAFAGDPPGLWYAAHNVWLQVQSEIGLAGLCWLMVGCAIMARTRSSSGTAARPIRAGLFASLVFAAIHAAVDYGPSIPFNAAMISVVAGLYFGGAGVEAPAGPVRARQPGKPALSARLLVLGLVLALGVGAVRFAVAEARMFDVRDLVARQLSAAAEATGRVGQSREAVRTSRPDCALVPPSKAHLRSEATLRVLDGFPNSSPDYDPALATLRQHQAIGRPSAAVMMTVVAMDPN